jgi:quercetin dioxygenase-like cupin family protein
MRIIRKEDLPFIGSSYNFAGAEHGDVAISMFLVEAQPGRGAPLHSHDYDEVVLVLEGHSRFVLGDEIRELTAGTIAVVKARTPHGFVNCGEGTLKQLALHVNSKFEQQALDPTDVSREAKLPQPKSSDA